MNSANQSSACLLLLAFSIFQLAGARINGNFPATTSKVEAEIGKIFDKHDDEQGDVRTAVLTKPDILPGLSASSSGRRQWTLLHQSSPAQTPEAEAAESTKTNRKRHNHMIVAISASASAMLLLIVFMAVLLLARRRRRRSRGLSGGTNKVSFDPEPDMFYLDSISPFLQCDSDHKPSFGLPSEGIGVHSESQGDESAKRVECSSSEGSESFHSACCSHFSTESTSTDFEQIFGCSPNGHLSAFTCSRFAEFPTQSTKRSLCSNLFISSNMIDRTPPSLLPPSQPPWLEMTLQTNSSEDIESSSRTEKVEAIDSKQDRILQSEAARQTLKRSDSKGSIPSPPPLPPPPFQKSRRFGKFASPSSRPQQSAGAQETGSRQPKLKPLHWDKVRAAPDRSMAWDKIRPSSFVLDEKTMESLFGYNMHCPARNEEPKCKNLSPGKQVLEHKRLQNFTILLKPLNATAEQVCSALLQGCGLGIQQLEALAKMVPTKEEEERICKYGGDMNELGSTERFLKVILSVPLAFPRLEAMLFRETFEDEVMHLKKSFAILEEACRELRSSRLFLGLLEAVLKTGNRMNLGTARGEAKAFKLDALLKLADVKGADGKTTLLHFLVQETTKSEGLIAMKTSRAVTTMAMEEDYNTMELELAPLLSSELGNVKKTASMDFDALTSSVSNLSKGMKKITVLVEGELSINVRDASFLNSMKSFKKEGQEVMQKLKDSEDQVFRHVREITEYFHGDGSKDEANPLRIFLIVSDFLGMLDRVCKELKSKEPANSSSCSRALNLII